MTPVRKSPRGARKPVSPVDSPFEFSFGEFEDWYENMYEARFDPARSTFERLLNEWLTHELSDSDRKRILVSRSRIKGVSRLWAKMQKPKYRSLINTLDSITQVVDDIVGIRITCHNNCDMSTLRDLVQTLPAAEEDNDWLCVQSGSEKRYVDDPKDTGYRAYHVNVRTLLQTPQGWVPVIGEVQARTLLQDGWGELTHEDTYKPGVALPGLASTLARRMADLLATVDDIAQDLRDELDRLAAESIESRDDGFDVGTTDAESTPALQGALKAETRRVVLTLTKPATLASVAQRVQASFGTGITERWGGYPNFSALVIDAVPGAVISPAPPGWVTPPGYHPRDAEFAPSGSSASEVPRLIRRLRVYDQNVPMWNRERIGELLSAIEWALRREHWESLDLNSGAPNVRELNALTKLGRDWAAEEDIAISRAPLNYMMRALLVSNNLIPDLNRASIAAILQSALFDRARTLGLVEQEDDEKQELGDWLAPDNVSE